MRNLQTRLGELRQAEAVAELVTLEADSVHAVITDPPYASGGLHAQDRRRPPGEKYSRTNDAAYFFWGDNLDQRAYFAWSLSWAREAWRILRPGGAIVVFIDWRQLPLMTDMIQIAGYYWKGVAAWDKRNARPVKGGLRAQCEYVVWGVKPGGKPYGLDYLPGCVSVPAVASARRRHLTQKPLELMRMLVRIAPPEGLVVDPFVGSGSTLVACELEHRRWFGCEVDARHFASACDRLREIENEQPVKVA